MKRIVVILFFCSSVFYSQVKMDDAWKDIFREDELTKKYEKETREVFEKTGNGDSVKMDSLIESRYRKLEQEAVKNKVNKTNLKFGLEILRANEKKDEILLRKYQFPLPDIKDDLVKLNYIKEININAYAGLFSIPIQKLNQPEEFFATLKDNQKESAVFYGIILVPQNKEGNVYTFKLTLVTDVKLCGEIAHTNHRGIELKIPIGGKVKIAIGPTQFLVRPELNYISGMKDTLTLLRLGSAFPITVHAESISSHNDNWFVWRNINGKEIRFGSDNDFFKGTKDYLILSFEDDK